MSDQPATRMAPPGAVYASNTASANLQVPDEPVLVDLSGSIGRGDVLEVGPYRVEQEGCMLKITRADGRLRLDVLSLCEMAYFAGAADADNAPILRRAKR